MVGTYLVIRCSVRTDFSYEVSMLRVGDLGLRAALFRLGALAVLVIFAVVGRAPWLASLPIAVALIGTYLSAATNYSRIHDDRNPRDPLTNWAFDLTLSGSGRMKPDVPGTLESISYIPLGIIGPYLMHDSDPVFRLTVLAAALAWVGSCVVAVFVDPAFYSPHSHAWRFVDWARRYLLGVVVLAIAVAVVLPAHWSSSERTLAFGLCLVLAGAVQLRVRETDRLLAQAATTSTTREIVGRHTMVEAVHELIGPATSHLRVQLTEHPEFLDTLDERVSDLESGYSDVLSMENDLDRELDWPGRLRAHLDRLSRLRKVKYDLNHPEALHRVDRAIAHQVLHNLATNAASAKATKCSLTLTREGDFLVVRASDDGQPVERTSWTDTNGGLRRARARLARTGPGSSIELVDDGADGRPKLIIAKWRGQQRDKEHE